MSTETHIPKIILDTDIDTDSDDAGALAVLHTNARSGQAEILGVVCSIPWRWCAPCVHAINRWYGRGDLPVGEARVPDWETSPVYRLYHEERKFMTDSGRLPLYNESVSRAAFGAAALPESEEATSLYRRLLAREPDRSVTICAIGTLTVLAQLLQSGPDEFSPLTGMELVRLKVRQLVTMAAAAPPAGSEEFNWRMDLPAAERVVRDWPGPLIVSEHGVTVLTGKRFLEVSPEDHPAAVAYRFVLGRTGEENRPSWDQLAVLYATGLGKSWFKLIGQGSIRLRPGSPEYEWLPATPPADRRCLSPLVSDAFMAEFVETMMSGDS